MGVAMKQDGSLLATGRNHVGQLGDGTLTLKVNYVKVIDDGVKDVCTGDYTTFVIKKDGTLWATGHNNWSARGWDCRQQKIFYASRQWRCDRRVIRHPEHLGTQERW